MGGGVGTDWAVAKKDNHAKKHMGIFGQIENKF